MKNLERTQAHQYLFSEMENRYPHFRKIITTSPYFSKNEFIFEHAMEKGNSYIIIIDHHKGEPSFTIEVGWSENRRAPQLPMRPLDFRLGDANLLSIPEFTCRLFALANSNASYWLFRSIRLGLPPNWVLEMAGIEFSGPGPFELLETHGIPFLQRWNASRAVQ